MKNVTLLIIIIMALSTPILKATEKDLYDFMWLDPDKKVYVLQNKIHKKEHSVYLNLGYGNGMSSTFVDTSSLHANMGFYLNEEFAVELLYSKYSNKENESFTNIKRINGVVPFIRKPVSAYGGIAKWSPFYGKINTFNKIFYFDWAFGLGAGKYNTESNKDTVSNANTANNYRSESYTSFIGKTELTFHASKNVHISLGLLLNNYKAPGPTVNGIAPAAKMRNDLDSILSVGFSF
jgi:outer membrane beta-barrel protein